MEEIERRKKFSALDQLTRSIQRTKRSLTKYTVGCHQTRLTYWRVVSGLRATYVESTRSQHSVPIPQKTKPKQTLRHLNCLVQNNKINQHCYITVMSVFLGSLTLEIPGNSSGKHTYCNSISFDTDCGKAKYMHYNILRQNFLPLQRT